MPVIGSPLRRAFAHNDFRQPRPLWDALEHGFTAVEADIFLVDGELQVGHGRADLTPGHTLQKLYLDPLAALVADRETVYDDVPLMLLVDVKSEAGPTYAALHALLATYGGLFTQYRHDGTLSAPVEVVVSGHTDLPQMEAQLIRYASADARLAHLDDARSPVVSMVSAKWNELLDLHALVERIHDFGCRARFWATGETHWPDLVAAGVDLIIADDLAGLRRFLSR